MKAIVAMNFPEVVKVPTHQKGHLSPPKRTLKKTDFILNHPTFFFMRLMRLRLRVIPKMKESLEVPASSGSTPFFFLLKNLAF